LIAGISGCGTMSEREAATQQMPLSAVPEPAHIVIEKLVAGGRIVEKERE
jgi:hypothetical protein